jgi:hypothetical protein
MFAKKEWFKRRKYGGWGISPANWKGYAYMAAVLLPFIIFQALPYWSPELRLYVTIGWVAFLFIDVTPVMLTVKRDELEKKIEAYSERNAAWAMMFVIIAGLLYQIISSALAQAFRIDLWLVAALLVGAGAKTITNIVLERRGVK